jgi:hypothetical protein
LYEENGPVRAQKLTGPFFSPNSPLYFWGKGDLDWRSGGYHPPQISAPTPDKDKIPAATPPLLFSGSSYSMRLTGTLNDQTVNNVSQTLAAKPAGRVGSRDTSRLCSAYFIYFIPLLCRALVCNVPNVNAV